MYKPFTSLVKGKQYDYNLAARHNLEMSEAKVKARELPAIEEKFLEENEKGGCLQISLALLKRIHETGKEAYLALSITQNPRTGEYNEYYASVYYRAQGSWGIADPVESVKEGKEEIYVVPVYIYQQKHGKIWLYDLYGEHGDKEFFKEFLHYPVLVL